MRAFTAMLMMAGGVLAATGAVAQAPPVSNPVPQGSPVQRILPSAPPSVAPGTVIPPPSAPAAEVPNRPVRVSNIEIEGVTAYQQAEIAPLTAGLIGPAVALPQIDAARQAILQRYRSDGYVLTTVSVNLDGNGRLRFVVTEGHIASVKLDGDIGPAGTQVLRFLNRLTEKQPIDSVTLERYLLLAQDVPGVSLRAVLEPSSDQPGALNLIAQVSRKEVSGLATIDNRAFNETGPVEMLGLLDFNSFTSLGEKTEVSYYHSLPNSQNFGQASTEVFIGASGLKGRIYGGYGTTVPTGSLGQTGYNGTTTVFGSLLSYPVIRSRQQTLNVLFAFDGLDSNITNTTSGVRAQASFDSLRILRLGEDYALSDLLLGADRSAVNAVSVRLSQGMKLLGATTNGISSTSPRQNEQTGFTKINFEASRTQTLFTPWDGASVALMGLVTGQWTNVILPPAEQFYLGGARFTRGYYAGQVPGDKALASTVELQLNTGFETTVFGKSLDIADQFYLFYDWGETWQNLSTDHSAMINSAGGGVRTQLTRYVEVDLEGLARFNRFPNGGNSPGSGVSPLYGGAFYWRVLTRF
ncbi:MAG TPA: ShlB/FhaC/HecB family hemolysin secretion/activation protein [Acetobacteraceae bacterium]|jgi:hemolysin activation/secretion protein|nr:ShlB/FhaC/HecB family hemolysin secretion/activation protein [Acetobacteraceae bacterium]HUD59617.1 ShlB/FhaC/HecB family hemolysin secretion/activation protein [Acetobacteraceae bacterium]